MDTTLNRQTEYLGVVYQIIEVLSSGYLLVIEKSLFDRGVYPLAPLVIPGE